MTAEELDAMSIEELSATRLRLVVELWVVEKELTARRHADYRRRKPKISLTTSDLQERRGNRTATGVTAVKKQAIAKMTKASALGDALKQLTPDELAKVQEALRKLKEKTK